MSTKQPETRGNLHDLINFHSIGKTQQTKKGGRSVPICRLMTDCQAHLLKLLA